MDEEIAVGIVAQAGREYVKLLDQKWRESKAEEVSDCHDAIVNATDKFPRVTVFAALQLFKWELAEEVIREVEAQIKKREQIQTLKKEAQALEQSAKPMEESDKVQETLNHK